MQVANVVHSGGVGDLLYSLPTCKTFGKVNFYVKPSQYMAEPLAQAILPLLRTQSCVNSAEIYNRQRIDFDLDLFREEQGLKITPLSMVQMFPYQRYYNLSYPWMDKVEPEVVAPIVINRTGRYPGHIDYVSILQEFKDKCVFIGNKEEHTLFTSLYGNIEYHPTKDFLEVAKVICGSSFFAGNQSAAFAIAEGIKKPRIVEVCQDVPNCPPIGADGHSSWQYLDIVELIKKYVS